MSVLDEIRALDEGGIGNEVLSPNETPTTFDQWAQQTQGAVTQVPGVPMMTGQMPANSNVPDRTVPMVNPAPAPERGFMTGVTAGMIDDPMTRLKALSEQTGIPLDRMGYAQDGQIVYIDQDGQPKALTGGMAAGAGELAPEAFPIAGGFAGAAVAPVRKDLAGAAGAAAGLGVKKWLANLVWGDPVGIGDVGEIAMEGITDYTGSKGFRWGSRVLRRRGVAGIENMSEEAFQRERARIYRDTNIDLDLAQLTGLPQLKAMKIWAGKFPGEASEVIAAHDALVNGQVEKAVNRLATTIAKGTDPALSGIRGVNTANMAIETAKAEVDRLTGPMYKAAYEAASGLKIDVTGVLGMIDEMAKKATGSRLAALKRARKALMENEKRSVQKMGKDGQPLFDKDGMPVMEEKLFPRDDLYALQNAKWELDAMLGANPANPNALNNVSRRDITMLKEALLRRMEEASPEYAAANAKFAKAMKVLVEPLENSVIGILAKIPDHKAAQAAATLFTGGAVEGTVSPLAIKRARNAFLKQPGGERAWNGLVAQWIRQTLNKAMKPTQAGNIQPAGKWLSNALGTPSQQSALKAAVGEDVVPLLNSIEEALRYASRAVVGGSDTEFNRLISEIMSESGMGVLRRLLAPRKAAMDYLEDEYIQDAAMAVAEVLTNERSLKALRKLSAMPKSTENRIALLGLIFGSIGLETGQELMEVDPQPGTGYQEQ